MISHAQVSTNTLTQQPTRKSSKNEQAEILAKQRKIAHAQFGLMEKLNNIVEEDKIKFTPVLILWNVKHGASS